MPALGRNRPDNVFMQNTAGASFIVLRTTLFESPLLSEQRSLDCAVYARIYTVANSSVNSVPIFSMRSRFQSASSRARDCLAGMQGPA